MKSMDSLLESLDLYIEWAEANKYEVPICLSNDLKQIKKIFSGRKEVIFLPYPIGTTVWSSEPFKDKVVRDGSIVEYEIDDENVFIWVNFDPEPISVEFNIKDLNKTWFLENE